jgi:hypothetical protein
MSKVSWNAFVDGTGEESQVIQMINSGIIIAVPDNASWFIKRKCECCGNEIWIKHPLRVCANCVP